MCTINYLANAGMTVTPTVLDINFIITTTDPDVKVAIEKLNNIRKDVKKNIFLKDSLISKSFKQTEISVVKKFKTVETTKTINGEKKTVKDSVFDCYQALTHYSFTLKNVDTVIDDFTDILNMTIELDTRCNYNFNITTDEQKAYMLQLTSKAIDNGINAIKTIIAKSESPELANLDPIIVNINTQTGRSSAPIMAKSRSTLDTPATYDEIITPEMVKDMFNNKKIPLYVEVALDFDLKSSRAIY